MKIGGRYNWKNQPERLVYVGRSRDPGQGRWHQFEQVDAPGVVWCEVLDADLHMIEETAAPARCKGCDLPHGCPEYCRCTPGVTEAPALDYVEWKRRYAARLMHHGWNERAAIKEAEYVWASMEGVDAIPAPEDAADQDTAGRQDSDGAAS